MISTVKFSGMTKIKKQDGKDGWVGVKDVDVYPYTNGNGIVIWIWPENGERKKPICVDFAGPHGLEDLAKLVAFLQGKLQACKSPEEIANENRLRELAREQNGKDGELEFDDNGIVSISEDGGAYVQAWSWVYDPEMGDPEEEVANG